MDPVTALATASSITSLLQITGTTLSNGYEYLSKVVRGPKELRLLLIETAALDSLLDELQLLMETGDDGLRNAILRLERVGTLAESKEVLNTVQMAIIKCRQEKGQSAKNFGRRLLWPFKEKETKELLQRFHRLRATFTSALSIDTAAALRRMEPSIKKVEDETSYLRAEAEKRNLEVECASLISWLSYESIDVEDVHEDVLGRRQVGTHSWFFEEPSFRKWLLEENSLMWIYGIPGTGKTVLSSTVVEHLCPGVGTNVGLIFFFIDHRNPTRQSLRNLVGNGIRQLLQQDPNCIKDLKEVYEREKKEAGGRPSTGRPSTGSCLQMLKTLTLRFETVYVVVDALDECRNIEAFLDGLNELRSSNNTKTNAKILITSRQEIDIERQIRRHLTCSLCLTQNIGEDIRRFLTVQVQMRMSTGKLKVRDPALRNLIITALCDGADGMFLWASIQLERICGLRTDRDIKRNLTTLPIGLDGMYIRILEQIQKQRPEAVQDVKRVFQWLVGSFHPVPLEEIAEALAIQPGDVTLDQDGIANDVEDIAQLCSSLVTVDKLSDLAMGKTGKATPIAFAHMSIPEFLRSDRIKQSPVAAFHMDMPSVHTDLARTCVHYLSLSDFQTPCTAEQLDARTDKYALIRYASQYWMSHLKTSSMDSRTFDEDIMPHLRWFLAPASRSLHFQSWTQIFFCEIPGSGAGSGRMRRVRRQRPLFYALLYGVELLLNRIFLGGTEVNQLFLDDWTPLHIVAYAGHLSIARKLLMCGANVHAKSKAKGLTPLHIAAEQGHADIVRILLLHQANPHSQSSSSSTPFYRAPRGGSLEVLEILLKHGSDVNATTWDSWTALHEAVIQDNLAMVKKLLAWGTDPSISSLDGDTALNFAQDFHRWDIARLLSEHESMRVP